MAKLTLENLINILERKNVITKKDIIEEFRRIKGYKDSLLFKNLLTKKELAEVKKFLETKVREYYAPTSSSAAMALGPVYQLATKFEKRGGIQDINTLYRCCHALRKEMTPSLKSVMHKLEKYVSENDDEFFSS